MGNDTIPTNDTPVMAQIRKFVAAKHVTDAAISRVLKLLRDPMRPETQAAMDEGLALAEQAKAEGRRLSFMLKNKAAIKLLGDVTQEDSK